MNKKENQTDSGLVVLKERERIWIDRRRRRPRDGLSEFNRARMSERERCKARYEYIYINEASKKMKD